MPSAVHTLPATACAFPHADAARSHAAGPPRDLGPGPLSRRRAAGPGARRATGLSPGSPQYEEGEAFLRMKGVLTSDNPAMWDTVFYRI